MSDCVVDWYPDGKSVLFASQRDSEKERFNKFFRIPTSGDLPEKLPLAYAEFGSFSADGKNIALTFETQIGRTWKRYRGGNVADIHIFDLTDNSSENISKNNDAGDEFPMWSNDKIYFISDRGPENRMNLWPYDITAKSFRQLTQFADNDVHYPSLGVGEIVFEQGGKMYLFNIAAGNYKEVKNRVGQRRHFAKAEIGVSREIHSTYLSVTRRQPGAHRSAWRYFYPARRKWLCEKPYSYSGRGRALSGLVTRH